MSLLPGTSLGPYRILARLGKGGMGEVYRAADPRLEREVAIKVLPDHLSGDVDALIRFKREAKAVAALSHPNILAIFDVGAEQGVHYIVTELLKGVTLRNAELPMSRKRAIEIGVAVAEGLSAAHSKGITHRDLKPENIFLTIDGQVKILDFGLAKRLKTNLTPEGLANAETQAETVAGVMLGTVGYMSPEQVRCEPVEATSDIFSLGCVLYEMVSGKRPFLGTAATETLAAILRDEPPSLPDAAWQRVIGHCLEKDPAKRFLSARDLAFALQSLGDVASPDAALAVPKKKQGSMARRAAILGIAAVVFTLAILSYLSPWKSATEDSLAVLPFVNVNNDPNSEYLSDGISQSLIENLSRLPGLRVNSWDSVLAHKGKEHQQEQIARLDVRTVLTGEIEQRGRDVSILVELVDSKDRAHIWSERYDNRKIEDLLAISYEISRQISERVHLKLTSADRNLLQKRSTENPEANEFYWKGIWQWNLRTGNGLKASLDFFDQALEKDPRFAMAFAGKANSLIMLSAYGVQPPKSTFPRAREAVDTALDIDPRLADAYAARARIKAQYDWDWPGAEQDYKSAIALNLSNGTAHQWYGISLAAVGKLKEALAQGILAREVQPGSRIINANVGWFYYVDRQYDRAIEEANTAINMDPKFQWGYNALGSAYVQKGRYSEAIAEFQKAATITARGPSELTFLAHAYGASGRKEDAQKVIEELNLMSQSKFVPPEQIAMIYAGLGDNDQALDWLKKAIDLKSMNPFYLPDPRYDNLRSDPRFKDLMRRIKL